MELEIDAATIEKHLKRRQLFLNLCINFLAHLGAISEIQHDINIFKAMKPLGIDKQAQDHWLRFVDLLQQMKTLADDIVVVARANKRKT